MTNQHPITPPPELVVQWRNQAPEGMGSQTREMWIATQSARWGADMEMEASLERLGQEAYIDAPCRLRAARRPKPPSLKEQALKALKDWTDEKHGPGGEVFLCEGLSVAIIRRALEALPE
jgi:hypothetical protein